MTSTHTSGSSRRILGSFLVLSIFAAALATGVAAPAAASANLAVAQPNEWQINESEWFINDAPTLHGRSWWGGNLAEDMNRYGQPYGYGPSRHNGSSYAYVSEDTGDPADHWARWDMGTREGTQELAVFVPRADASARVRYRITIGSRSTYTDRITQLEIYGWHSLGTVTVNGDRVRIEVHYNDSQTSPGGSGPAARTVGVDAMAMRCVSNCSTRQDVPDAPRNVRLQVVNESDGSRTVVATWSPPTDNGGSAITNYRVTFSRPGKTFSTVRRSSSARRHSLTGAWSNTTYKVQVRAENAVGVGSAASRSITTPTPTPPGEAPDAPRNVRLQVVNESDGSRTVVATWSPPTDNGGSAITNYRVTFSRPGKTFSTVRRSSSARRHSLTSARSNTTYKVQVRAENAIGVGPAATMTVTTPPGTTTKVYIDDTPILEGRKGLNCLTGGTKSCWKIFQHRTNTYWYRPAGDEFEIKRTVKANDYWGTNGFHVVYIDPEDKNRATWRFDDVESGAYRVGIYLPDVNGDNHWQPGAIVRYRVEVNRNRVLTKQIDQSRRHNKGGAWIDLGDLTVPHDAVVQIYVSDYWPGGSKSDSYAAHASGREDWEHHLAADAARLMPTNPDWSSLGYDYDSAVRWCQTDVVIKLLSLRVNVGSVVVDGPR